MKICLLLQVNETTEIQTWDEFGWHETISKKKTRIRNVQSGLTKYTYQAIFFSLISFYITGSYCQSATRYITFYNVCHDNISYQSNWQFSIRHRLVVSTLLWAHDLLFILCFKMYLFVVPTLN